MKPPLQITHIKGFLSRKKSPSITIFKYRFHCTNNEIVCLCQMLQQTGLKKSIIPV